MREKLRTGESGKMRDMKNKINFKNLNHNREIERVRASRKDNKTGSEGNRRC